jgi:uracil-DNA glycosylase family 4
MSKNLDLITALSFYIENGLNEVYSNKLQNNFVIKKTMTKESTEQNFTQNINQDNSQKNSFIKPIFSTSQAISTLAKKSQQISNLQINNSDSSSLEKFLPLNDIVERARNIANQCQDLNELKKAVENFDGCNLKKMATNTVFSDGNPDSEIMVIGEAPGNNEDLQGIPFCGDSGILLNEMLNAVNLTRKKDFYITNVIFWRPPGNRRPSEEELAICRPFVEKHIQLFAPKVIILVGATAMSAILGINEPITKIRGRFLDYKPDFLSKNTKTFTIFHPSFLMRQPAKKKVAWQDMLSLENFVKNNFYEQ